MAASRRNAACHVYWAHVDTSQDTGWGLLDTIERERARGYRHDVARARFVLGRGLARLAVAQLTEVEPESVRFRATCRHCGGPHGRLEVDMPGGPLRLSVTHSDERVGVALTRGVYCGLDIERVALRGGALPGNALSPVERAALAALPEPERIGAFIRTWTRKEAVLKATGDGLLVPPAGLTMSAPSQPARLVSWIDRPPPHTAVHLRDLDVGPGYRASLASLEVAVDVVRHEADPRRLAGTPARL